MNEELTKILDTLAARFGTTATHLWEVMIRQAVTEATAKALLAVVSIAVTVAVIRKTIHAIAAHGPDDNRSFPWILLTMGCAAFTFLPTALNFMDIVTGFMNPEFWALQQILNASR